MSRSAGDLNREVKSIENAETAAKIAISNYAHEMTKVQAKIETWQDELKKAILEERGTHIDRALEMIKIYANDLAYYARHASDHSAVLSISRSGVMKPLASHRLDLTGPESDWQLSHTACNNARESGLAVLMADQLDDLSIRDADSVDILKIRSIICVPLAQNPIRGLIYLENDLARTSS